MTTRLMRAVTVAVAMVAGCAQATAAAGKTEDKNVNTVSPNLEVTVTVQKAIRLTLETGSQCSISAGASANYAINFGNIDALGINTVTCGSKCAPATPGTTAAYYYSDYKITPIFTNQDKVTNTIKAYVATTFATLSGVLSVVQANSVPAAGTDLTTMGVTSGTAATVATDATSGTALTRYLGVKLLPTNKTGADAVNGSDTATVTYTMTVE
jgi:hypothetical protein